MLLTVVDEHEPAPLFPPTPDAQDCALEKFPPSEDKSSRGAFSPRQAGCSTPPPPVLCGRQAQLTAAVVIRHSLTGKGSTRLFSSELSETRSRVSVLGAPLTNHRNYFQRQPEHNTSGTHGPGLSSVAADLCPPRSGRVFFYFGVPTDSACILRFLPFLLFYTVCLACFVVRSFQIVCIFKIAAKLPKLLNLWMKYHGQWLLISVAFLIQVVLLTIGYSTAPPKPYNDTFWYADRIILGCDLSLQGTSGPLVLLSTLCCLCFIFSYMGKDLPKNYNEAKAITFCLFLLVLTWIIFATVSILYHGKYIQTFNALAVLSSLYSFLLWYFLPKCYIILFQPHKNTQQHFQGLIQDYTKTFSQ
ncbi:unnamed protein product [Menidia menidia]|uniref:(Atlantic silverside) hypothetical protein n=1 Tax=Menidia menidia TaxID=238744 RepID=A0A8S4BZF1_9TELE|nr:unnamed protein product [Menidia menidia]